MRVHSFGREYSPGNVKVLQNNTAPVKTVDDELTTDDRFTLFWDLMDTINAHGYTRAAMSVIGRTSVGTWFDIVKNKENKEKARDLQRRKLKEFYFMKKREWDNIKDYYGMPYKLMISVMYLRYFGQAAFHILRDNADRPIGMDFLHGFVIPNVDEMGYFKEGGAFFQFPLNDRRKFVSYNDPRDIVYLVNPDWEGYSTGGTDIRSLVNYSLPLDIYLQTAAREYLKNRNKPEAFYIVSNDISDTAFDELVGAIEAKYSGPSNIGRNPVVLQGELDIKETRQLPRDLPYQEARKDTRTENLAVSGVPGAKLGISEDLSGGNLRELRREFHESSMEPIFTFVEQGFYDQIHVREFDYSGWDFKFKMPDFLTEVEKATVDMRYYSIGTLTPNEIRNQRGLDERTDELGDMFVDEVDQMNAPSNTPLENPDTGSPPEGREDEPDAPANTGEPTNDDQDPPRGDNHDDESIKWRNEILKARSYLVNSIRKGKPLREFKSDIIPQEIMDDINERALTLTEISEAKEFMDDILDVIKGVNHGGKRH
jgi:hypothetical protein